MLNFLFYSNYLINWNLSIISILCVQYRKVQMESATGSSNSYRVRTTLTISVENIDFDTQACVLRLKGRNVEENKYVKVEYITDI